MRLPTAPDGWKFHISGALNSWTFKIVLIPAEQDEHYAAYARYMDFFDYKWQARPTARRLLHRFRADRADEHWIREVNRQAKSS